MILEPHKHAGIFIAKGKEAMLVTKNIAPGESVYGEKRISIDGGVDGTKVEYRVWNPFRSKLAAGVLGGMDHIYIAPGKKVLYLGAASGTSVSHVADIVGPVSQFYASVHFFPSTTRSFQEGVVYAVEFSPRSGRDLINMAKKRTNVIRASDFLAMFGRTESLLLVYSNRGRRSFPKQVPHAYFLRRCHLRGRCAARSSSYRCAQCAQFLEAGWPCCHLHQGKLYRLDGTR